MLHTAAVDRLLELTAPEGDDVLDDMEAQAEREGFPTVGREVGAFLRLCARLTGAESAFELGSGFGYSAYWVAEALPANGRVVLTEFDEGELDQARTYFERGGYADRAVFEAGDALEIVERYDGPFDLVLVDHQNEKYVEGFEAVREKVAPGGVVVADNVLHSTGQYDPEDFLAELEGEEPGRGGQYTGAIADYYRHVSAAPEFETTTMPVGEGLFVSVRVE
ncbi:MAG: O-methyltransferase [Halobacteriaceae archaeon]